MKEDRIRWISMAQVSACFAVVMLHCNGVFWQFPTGRLWYTSNFIECFFYWAVPVFFMISGATLLDYQDRYSTSTFLKKRLLRIAVPFVAWSCIGIIYSVHFEGLEISGWKEILDGVVNTKFVSVYWYFIPLIGVYLCMPFAAAIAKENKVKVYFYSLIVGFLFTSVIPTFCKVMSIPFNAAIIPTAFNGYIWYTFVGYLIQNFQIPYKFRKILYVLGIVGFAVQFFGTDVLSQRIGSIDSTFKGYLNFPAVLQSIAVMVLFRYLPYDKLNKNVIHLIDEVSKRTFGVYLMHIYLVWQLPKILHVDPASIYFRTIGAVGIFFVCVLLCWLVSRIPVLNKILGC